VVEVLAERHRLLGKSILHGTDTPDGSVLGRSKQRMTNACISDLGDVVNSGRNEQSKLFGLSAHIQRVHASNASCYVWNSQRGVGASEAAIPKL
jgi:hypothetical protein